MVNLEVGQSNNIKKSRLQSQKSWSTQYISKENLSKLFLCSVTSSPLFPQLTGDFLSQPKWHPLRSFLLPLHLRHMSFHCIILICPYFFVLSYWFVRTLQYAKFILLHAGTNPPKQHLPLLFTYTFILYVIQVRFLYNLVSDSSLFFKRNWCLFTYLFIFWPHCETCRILVPWPVV